MGLAGTAYTEIEWSIYPGTTSRAGQGKLYEDDGETIAYLPSEGSHYVWIEAAYEWDASNSSLTLTVAADDGAGFVGQPTKRLHSFRLPCTLPPTNVTLHGASLAPAVEWGEPLPFAGEWAATTGSGTWTYDSEHMETVVHLPPSATSKTVTLSVSTPRAGWSALCLSPPGSTSGGVAGTIRAARRAKAVLDEARIAPGAHALDPLGTPLNELAMSGDHLAYLAGHGAAGRADFLKAAANVSTLRSAAVSQLRAHLGKA